jgi:hypothetical protein
VFLFIGLIFVLLRVAVALFCPGEKEDREQTLIVIHSLLARFQGRTRRVVTGTTSPYCFTWRLAIWRPLFEHLWLFSSVSLYLDSMVTAMHCEVDGGAAGLNRQYRVNPLHKSASYSLKMARRSS